MAALFFRSLPTGHDHMRGLKYRSTALSFSSVLTSPWPVLFYLHTWTKLGNTKTPPTLASKSIPIWSWQSEFHQSSFFSAAFDSVFSLTSVGFLSSPFRCFSLHLPTSNIHPFYVWLQLSATPLIKSKETPTLTSTSLQGHPMTIPTGLTSHWFLRLAPAASHDLTHHPSALSLPILTRPHNGHKCASLYTCPLAKPCEHYKMVNRLFLCIMLLCACLCSITSDCKKIRFVS